MEEQGDDRAVDQAAALGGLRALEAASGAARAKAGGEDGGALVGGQAAARRRVGRGRSPEPRGRERPNRHGLARHRGRRA